MLAITFHDLTSLLLLQVHDLWNKSRVSVNANRNFKSPIAISNRQSPVQFQISNRQSPIASMLSVSPSITSCDSSSGNLGRAEKVEPPKQKASKSPRGFDDLLPGFGSGGPASGSRSNSEPVPVSVSKETSNTMDDPFVVLESASPPVTSSQVPSFIDPLETVHKINISKSTKTATSSKGQSYFPSLATSAVRTIHSEIMSVIKGVFCSSDCMKTGVDSIDNRSNLLSEGTGRWAKTAMDFGQTRRTMRGFSDVIERIGLRGASTFTALSVSHLERIMVMLWTLPLSSEDGLLVPMCLRPLRPSHLYASDWVVTSWTQARYRTVGSCLATLRLTDYSRRSLFDRFLEINHQLINIKCQTMGMDRDDTVSPVVKPTTIHTMLSLVVSRN
ncbi:hypothetical protein LXL04_015479 [Taraxacum kok-saghyz]